MIFVNLGDGYSSGCCTGSKYVYACDDPKYSGMGSQVEHPDSRPGSFVNQLGNMYRAQVLTFAKHRVPTEFYFDTVDQIINNVEQYNDQLIYFIGINNLRSRRVGDEYLMLDGLDETELSDEEYFKLCNAEVDSKTKINKIEEFLKQISTTANKIILYRTDAEPFDINVPDNCIVVPQSVTEMLKDDVPYRRSYYDKQTYKKITKTLLQYFINE